MSAAGPFPGTLLMPVFRSGGRIGHDLYIDTGTEPRGVVGIEGVILDVVSR